MTDHYDVIVIGSVSGGGTLTRTLAPTGKRIRPLLLREELVLNEWLAREVEHPRVVQREASEVDRLAGVHPV